MDAASSQLVVAFPISTSAFGLRPDWFEVYSPKLLRPAIFLMALLLVISIGILALKRFENADFEKKIWNLPVLFTTMVFWPSLVLGLKELVDTFDTFLVINVFGIPWQGFGFPEMGSVTDIVAWPTAGLARLLPNLAYWIVYAFYLLFFFFYTVLGPLLLVRGILFDEIESFLGLVKEFLTLLLWQTTLVILVAFIMPSIVSGKPFPARPETNFYFLSVVLGVMIFFVPSLTQKFGAHLEGAFFPTGFRWGGALLGLAAVGKLSSLALTRAGVPAETLAGMEPWKDRVLKVDEFKRRHGYRTSLREERQERHKLEIKLYEFESEERAARDTLSNIAATQPDWPFGEKTPNEGLFELAKKAKQEMKDEPGK